MRAASIRSEISRDSAGCFQNRTAMPTEKSIAEKFEALKTTMSESTYERSVQPEVDEFNADPEAYVAKIEKQKKAADMEDAADQTAQP